MKIQKTIAMLTIFMFLLSATSCVVVPRQHDNGRHKGWFIRTDNPHHKKRKNNYKRNDHKSYEKRSGKHRGGVAEISTYSVLKEDIYKRGVQRPY